MTVIELIAASLVLSVVVAAVAWLIGCVMEGCVRDPDLRERLWGMALYAVAIPPAVIGLSILMPASSTIPHAVPMTPVETISVLAGMDASGLAPRIDGRTLALVVLGLAVLASSIQALCLAVRVARLQRLMRSSRSADPGGIAAVDRMARGFDLSAPQVRIVADAAGPLLTGFGRPILLLPEALAAQPDAPAAQMICAHELAHLQRGDHRALWVEEILSTVLAANPLIRAIRDRRAAAREEACDALALACIGGDARRDYARTLVEALRRPPVPASQPALTFISSKRIFVMNRLNAILKPVSPAGLRTRSATLVACAALAALACTSSLAVAAQRQAAFAIIKPSIVGVEAGPALPSDIRVTAVRAVDKPEAQRLNTTKLAERGSTPSEAANQRVITNPAWTQTPQPQWPADAVDVSEAEVNLSCTADPDGTVSGCSVLSEAPVGVGFGNAAIVAAEQARLASSEARSVLRFTIRFRKS